jgi:hypothetical protein
MTSPKSLGFYWIQEWKGGRWAPAELVNRGGRLEVMVLGYDMGLLMDEIHKWGAEIVPPPYEEFEESEEDED